MRNDESHHDRVRLFRLASGLSQAELAEKLKVSPNVVAAIETGGRNPSSDFLDSFSSELGASMEWIIKGEGSPLRDGAARDAEEFISHLDDIRKSEAARRWGFQRRRGRKQMELRDAQLLAQEIAAEDDDLYALEFVGEDLRGDGQVDVIRMINKRTGKRFDVRSREHWEEIKPTIDEI